MFFEVRSDYLVSMLAGEYFSTHDSCCSVSGTSRAVRGRLRETPWIGYAGTDQDARRNQAKAKGGHALSAYPTRVEIHQVVPPASLIPPRLSSSPFCSGACTDSAPSASARA